MMTVGMILLGGLSRAAVQEVDYEARNYYNGDYNEYDSSSAITADDVIDDDVTTGARRLYSSRYSSITTSSSLSRR